ncbi:SOS response-associated peptidase [Ichthyenterobacterium sp. W332]|uniref:Abasic site processing protein n=1 Tax=Microcosmobacter mediterraneus TaxID=3075607 RepID=A0ABU2YGJ4_9FLAO|nr:SOS response-associated peptidase [Ichthyenterobacterium sp. W332]MDT0557157.1 SOS response-associated peptidase [Ichthyenterobacterium sp. W332]
MCYDINTSTQTQALRAFRKFGLSAVNEIRENLEEFTDLPLFHTSGFSHPELLIYTDRSPDFPEVATWGLIPHWINDEEQMKKIWNNTLNARGETIFVKPSFRESAINNRCLIYINGFYEHHHFNKKTYPFFIQRKDEKPIVLGGLWSEWKNPVTNGTIISFSIVTTEGNPLITKIHNNPKLKGPRMPLILNEELEDEWLNPIQDELDKKSIKKLIQSFPEEELKFHTVRKLRGKEYIGNVKEIFQEYVYEDLEF